MNHGNRGHVRIYNNSDYGGESGPLGKDRLFSGEDAVRIMKSLSKMGYTDINNKSNMSVEEIRNDIKKGKVNIYKQVRSSVF